MVERLVVERGLCFIRGVPRSRPRRAHLEHRKKHETALLNGCAPRCHRLLAHKTVRDARVSAWLQKDDIILYDVQRVFAVDALASSHPLSRREEEVNDPAEISEMFNTISYSKVCSSDTTQGEMICFFLLFKV